MSEHHGIGSARIGELLERYPFLERFFADEGLELVDEPELSLDGALAALMRQDPKARSGDWAEQTFERIVAHIELMLDFVSGEEERVESIAIFGGRAKDGSDEPVRELTLRAGEIVCIVGPTGSGKSRLLADIEWVAQGDTPTGRKVLINGAVPDRAWRFSGDKKLVAQLSQNMNFVMDLSVSEFLHLHAESRGLTQAEALVAKIFSSANQLAGEPFTLDTPVTALSGGQSRALMIADVALLSSSPVVLIDEIENAGIDRRAALDLLVGGDKIVLMATHDPILALYGQRRLVMRNGAMQRLITPTPAELENLDELRAIDARLMGLRQRLRAGELLEQL